MRNFRVPPQKVYVISFGAGDAIRKQSNFPKVSGSGRGFGYSGRWL